MPKKKTTTRNKSEAEKYLELTKKMKLRYGEKTIVFYQVGSFFEVYALEDPVTHEYHGSNIEDFSRLCDMNIAAKSNMKDINGMKVVMAGEPMHGNPEKKIQILVENGYTVPVWEQDEKVPSIRRQTHIESPAITNYFNNQIITNNMMCLWINKKSSSMINKRPFISFGMACVDTCTGSVNISEYMKYFIKRQETTLYDSLSRFYSIHNPSEIIIIHNFDSPDDIDIMMQYAGVQSIKIHIINVNDKDSVHYNAVKNSSSQTYQQTIIERYYTIPDYSVFMETHKLREKPNATSSMCFLIDFIYTQNPSLTRNLHDPLVENIENSLQLGTHSLSQLNILETGKNGQYSSVVKLLNKCKTPMGTRKFRHQLLHPSIDSEYLKREYDTTQYIINNWKEFEEIRKKFARFKDMERLYRKILVGKISPSEVIQLLNNIWLLHSIHNNFLENLSIFDKIIKYLDINVPDVDELSYYTTEVICLIEDNIDEEVASKLTNYEKFDKNFFKPGICPEVDEIDDTISKSELQLTEIGNFLDSLLGGEKKVKKYKTEKSPVCFTTTNTRSIALQDELLKIDWTHEKNKDYYLACGKDLSFKKRTKTEKIIISTVIDKVAKTIFDENIKLSGALKKQYKEFVKLLAEKEQNINLFVQYISLIDVIMNKAYIALKYNYCCPTISDDAPKSFVSATKLRHPLIENIQKEETYVANDLFIGCDNRDGVLLYGTNAAGKTSFIKSMGIAIIMAQAGCFVPASSLIYKPYTAIYTRILGNDNLFKGLSTFQVEMCELNTILRCADENSLILGDELCSGTEINSAVALVTSGIEELNSKNASYIFATHLHQLTTLSEITSLERLVFKHMSVKYDKASDELIWTRILEDGPGDNMYGLEVCKSLRMPDTFLQRAFNLRLKLTPEANGVLSKKKSRYNANKLKGNCEICGKKGVDIHHLRGQEFADKNGFIDHIHKNHPANIVNICKKCHHKETQNKTQRRKTKTSTGHKLLVCN